MKFVDFARSVAYVFVEFANLSKPMSLNAFVMVAIPFGPHLSQVWGWNPKMNSNILVIFLA